MTDAELQALASKIRALPTSQKLSSAIIILDRGDLQGARDFVRLALDDIDLAIEFPAGQS